MKIKVISLGLAGISLLTNCTSTTIIQSSPSGAKIYIDGHAAGTTPYTIRDQKVIFSSTDIKLEKEGYETLYTSFSKDERLDIVPALAGTFCFFPFLLWAAKYRPVHTYDLNPLQGNGNSSTSPWDLPREQNSGSNPSNPSSQPNQIKSKAERLKELKGLLDEKLITQDEYERERKKIIEEK